MKSFHSYYILWGMLLCGLLVMTGMYHLHSQHPPSSPVVPDSMIHKVVSMIDRLFSRMPAWQQLRSMDKETIVKTCGAVVFFGITGYFLFKKRAPETKKQLMQDKLKNKRERTNPLEKVQSNNKKLIPLSAEDNRKNHLIAKILNLISGIASDKTKLSLLMALKSPVRIKGSPNWYTDIKFLFTKFPAIDFILKKEELQSELASKDVKKLETIYIRFKKLLEWRKTIYELTGDYYLKAKKEMEDKQAQD